GTPVYDQEEYQTDGETDSTGPGQHALRQSLRIALERLGCDRKLWSFFLQVKIAADSFLRTIFFIVSAYFDRVSRLGIERTGITALGLKVPLSKCHFRLPPFDCHLSMIFDSMEPSSLLVQVVDMDDSI